MDEPATLKLAIKQTANFLSLVIWAVACIVTLDPLLFGAGIFFEALYVTCALHPRYQERIRKRPLAEDRLDPVLLGVTVAGVLFILFFGFCKHLLNNYASNLTHAEGWEVGAIIWTGLFLIYYLAKFKMPGSSVNNLPVIIYTVLGLILLGLAWHFRKYPVVHLGLLLLIAILFSWMDRKQIEAHRNDPKEAERSRSSFYWADLPMVVSFVVLLGYLLLHPDAEHQDVFVSGVVACQLLFSNSVFVVMEFAVFQPPDKSPDVRPAESGAAIGIPLLDALAATHAAEPATAGSPLRIQVPGLDSEPD